MMIPDHYPDMFSIFFGIIENKDDFHHIHCMLRGTILEGYVGVERMGIVLEVVIIILGHGG